MLTPSGGAADAGVINVTANLNCGTQILAAPRTLNFSPPVISSPFTICFGGNTVTMTGIAPGVSVQWAVSANMVIVSGQGSSTAVIRALTNFVGEPGTISATVSCPNTPVAPRSVWVGRPDSNTSARLHASSQYGVNPVSLYPEYNYNFSMDPVGGATHFNWDPLPAGFVWPNGWTGSTSQTVVIKTAAESGYYILACQPQNVCGLSSARFLGINIDGGGIMMRITSPNPSDEELNVEVGETDDVKAEIVLTSQNGKVVYRTISTGKTHKIPTRDFPEGIYVLKIIKNNSIIDRQIVIRH